MYKKKVLAILACLALLACLLTVTVSADQTAGVVVTADKTDVAPGDTITYTVTLTGAAQVDGGVWNYEYYLSIPEGLTLVDGTVVDATEFTMGIFNKDAKMGTSMGRLGSGYSGGDLILATFTCTVNAAVEGELTVATYGVILTDQDNNGLQGVTGSATVKSSTVHICAPEAVAEVPATCISEGVKAHSKCACGKLYVDGQEVSAADLVIPKGGHTEEVIPAKEATCVDTGLTEGKKCSVCGEILEQQQETPMADHTFVGVEGREPTCTQPGLTDGGYCSVCNYYRAQTEIPATGHTEVTLPGSAASCVLAGKTAGTKCSVCETVLVEQTVIPATGHTVIEVAGVEPTCSSTGLTAGKFCVTCSETLSGRERIDMLPHTPVAMENVEATCSAEGTIGGTKCSVCQSVLEAPQMIPKLTHTVVVLEAVAPACNRVGLTEGSKCSACGEILTAQIEISKLAHTYDNNCDATCNSCGEERSNAGHQYGSWTVSKEATEDSAGERTRTCTKCGQTEKQAIPALEAGGNMGWIVAIAFVVMIASVAVIIVLIRKKN